MSKLVIVESPNKVKKIREILGKDYKVMASVGHIRDLPAKKEEVPRSYQDQAWARTGVDVDNGFKPLYIVSPRKKDVVKTLKDGATGASEVYLATDDDREGEAIAWHLREELRLRKGSYKRMVFHEITPDAVRAALQQTRDIDMNLVRAQEARRSIDRLYGYEVSPPLWNMIAGRLSAGRVQSVATRIVVERERARMRFTSAGFPKVNTILDAQGKTFSAGATHLDGARLATGKDFDPDTGEMKKGVIGIPEDKLKRIGPALKGQQAEVKAVERKPITRKPAAPFTTSTLQQEASRKLGWTSRKTAEVSQKLYEQGMITYIRTDSPHLSDEAIKAARDIIEARYGQGELPAQGRQYAAKKDAQEAHEAIRPAGKKFQAPDQVKGLSPEGVQLYTLIYDRTIASQMKDAQGQQTSITLSAHSSEGEFTLAVRGVVIESPGFMAVYQESDSGSGDSGAGEDDGEGTLPDLKVGDHLPITHATATTGKTQPPGRYDEGRLIAALEGNGVGRPSTYAATMGTLLDRGYVQVHKKNFIPTWTALAVTTALETHMGRMVDYDFTAKMERDLDLIAEGKASYEGTMEQVYRGPEGLHELAAQLRGKSSPAIPMEHLGAGTVAHVRSDGAYISRGGRHARVPADILPGDLTAAEARRLLDGGQEGELPPLGRSQGASNAPVSLGTDPQSGLELTYRSGRFGPYIQLGEGEDAPKGSVPDSKGPDDITVEEAVKLVMLNRKIGTHQGKTIRVGVGAYGPYIRLGDKKGEYEYRSVTEEQALSMTIEQAAERFAEAKRTNPESSRPTIRRSSPRRGSR